MIATVGEVRGLNLNISPGKYMCSCGQEYLSCNFWEKVEKEMKKKISPEFRMGSLNTKFIPMSGKLLDRLQFKDLRIELLEKLRDYFYMNSKRHKAYINKKLAHCWRLAESVTEIRGKNIFFDTSKTPDAMIHLSRNLACEFKVIFLVRDGRGVLNSFIKKKIPLSELEISKSWLSTNKKIERILKRIPNENIHTVLYKDLCLEPQKTLRQICNFVGVEYENQCLKYWEHEHHIIGNKMRLNIKKQIQYDESWRHTLTTQQLSLFDKIAGRYNKKWG
jgi:hypothetical protein